MWLARRIIFVALTAMLATVQGWATCVASTDVFGTAAESAGLWTYSFGVNNGCNTHAQPFMTDFYVPYFADADIADITVPPPDTTSTSSTITWTATIDPSDNLFGLSGAGVIDFAVTASPDLLEGVSGVGYYGASGFSFTSTYAPVEGPGAVLQLLPPDYGTSRIVFGDPPIPGSPDTIAALAPEPSTGALMAIGLLGVMTLVLIRRRIWNGSRPGVHLGRIGAL